MFRLNTSPPASPRLFHPFKIGKACVAIAALTGIHFLPFTKMVLAQAVIPGIVIENQATGSYIDPTDSTSYTLESNIVQVTVAEVAGITLKPTGFEEAPAITGSPSHQGDGIIDAEDRVYFIFTATNVGNDPTQFFVPGSPSNIINGIQDGAIEIIEIDPDGPNGPTAPTSFSALPITIRPEGNNTGDATALGLPVGSIPVDGTITLRVPVKVDAGLIANDTVSVTMGDVGPNDNSAATQNQDYDDDNNNQDFYTQDNGDGVADEAAGTPINGDSTFHRKEASARLSVTVGFANTDYGDAPDTGSGSSADNYNTLLSDDGPRHVIDPTLALGTGVSADTDGFVDGTDNNNNASDDTDDAFTSSLANVPITGSYDLSNIPVTNSTSNPATLHAWIDFDQDGAFESDEYQTSTVAAGASSTSLSWTVPSGTTAGTTYARFRLTTQTLNDDAGTADVDERSLGAASDGEVEDYQIVIQNSTTGSICANPLSSSFNTSNYPINQELQNDVPAPNGTPFDPALAFFNGSMTFNFSLSGNANFNGGVQVQNLQVGPGGPPVVLQTNPNLLRLQPQNTASYLGPSGNDVASGNDQATYILKFPNPVTDFRMDVGGLNNADGTTISASFQGVPITITGDNFSDLSPGMTLRDTDNDTQVDTAVGTIFDNSLRVDNNRYTLSIPGPVDTVTIISGKADTSTGNVTIGLFNFFYCLDPVVTTRDPNVLLVKRITGINDSTTNSNDPGNAVPLDAYEDDSASPYDDNTLDVNASPPDTDRWPDPSTFLLGAINGGITQPDDEIEYTIYFLSAGTTAANGVQFCDRIPDGQTFAPNPTFTGLSPNPTPSPTGLAGEDRGILVSYNGNNTTYTNIGGDDTARFYPPGSGLPPACNLLNNQSEHNGAVVVNLGNLPSATSPGTPNDSYGFVRFRATVNP